jgi:hypothetical protein
MRRFVVLAFLVTAAAAYPAVLLAGGNGSDNGTMCVFTTQLSPANEVPPTTSSTFGHTQIKIRNDATIEWKTHIVNDGETFTGGHVHAAPAGVNGSIVVPLFAGSDSSAQFRDSGEKAIDPPALAANICAHPEQYYVNYHTTANPGGALRGQLG